MSQYQYQQYFNHEATDGKQPTDSESEEDEDKWDYTGCTEMLMLKRGRGASFTWPHLRTAVQLESS